MKLIRVISPLLILGLPLLSGCAITMNMPVSRFDTPETQGKLGSGYLAIGADAGNQLTLVQSTTADAPTDQNRSFSSWLATPTMAGLGILDRLDAELRFQGGFSGTSVPLLKLKFQFLGEPRVESKPGNFSMATTFGAGFSSYSQGDQSLGSVTATSNLHFWEIDSAVITGYRLSSSVLFYGGPYFSHYGFNGKITQSGSGAAPLFNFAGSAGQGGINFGVCFGEGNVQFKTEVAYAYASTLGTDQSVPAAGALLIFYW